MKSEPVCVTIYQWLSDNLGGRCLAPLTGQDRRALDAAIQIIELYSYDRSETVLEAFGLVVRRMQPKMWPLAYHAIAHVLDWSDRCLLWRLAGLPDISVTKCAWEPGGSARGGVS